MVQRLVQILFTYEYIDDNGNFEDCIYMRENMYIDYDNFDTVKRIVEVYFDETDKSKVVKEIKEVCQLGLRLV